MSELLDFIKDYGGYAGAASVLGLAVLSLLYFAQAREVKRLREWAGRAPERAAELEQRVSADAARRASTGTLPPRTPPPPRGGQPQTAAARAAGANGQGAPTPAPAASGVAPAAAAAAGAAGAQAAATTAQPGEQQQGEQAPADATKVEAPANGEQPTTAQPGEAKPAEEGAATPDGAAAAPAAPAAPDGAAEEPDAERTGVPRPPVGAPAAAAAAAGGTAGAGMSRAQAAGGTVPPRTVAGRPRAAAPLGARSASATLPPGRVGADGGGRRSRTPFVIAGIALGVLVIGVVLALALGGGGDDEGAASSTTPSTNVVTPPAGSEKQKEPVSRKDTTVAVLNGTTVNGLAATTAEKLRSSGFTVPQALVKTASVQNRSATVVSYVEGASAEARTVARVIGVGTDAVAPIDQNTRVEAGDTARVVVTVGADQNQSSQSTQG